MQPPLFSLFTQYFVHLVSSRSIKRLFKPRFWNFSVSMLSHSLTAISRAKKSLIYLLNLLKKAKWWHLLIISLCGLCLYHFQALFSLYRSINLPITEGSVFLLKRKREDTRKKSFRQRATQLELYLIEKKNCFLSFLGKLHFEVVSRSSEEIIKCKPDAFQFCSFVHMLFCFASIISRHKFWGKKR